MVTDGIILTRGFRVTISACDCQQKHFSGHEFDARSCSGQTTLQLLTEVIYWNNSKTLMNHLHSKMCQISARVRKYLNIPLRIGSRVEVFSPFPLNPHPYFLLPHDPSLLLSPLLFLPLSHHPCPLSSSSFTPQSLFHYNRITILCSPSCTPHPKSLHLLCLLFFFLLSLLYIPPLPPLLYLTCITSTLFTSNFFTLFLSHATFFLILQLPLLIIFLTLPFSNLLFLYRHYTLHIFFVISLYMSLTQPHTQVTN